MENNKTQAQWQAEVEQLQMVIDQLETQLASFYQRSRRDMEIRLATTINHIPLAIINLDQSGLIISANPGFLKLFGLQAEEIVNQVNIKAFEALMKTELGQKLVQLVDTQTEFDIETNLNLKKDSEGFFRCRGIKVSGELSDSYNFILIIGDISKRKLTEHELVIAKEKAEESDKLKTAFLTSMSHEIRTPMNHIIGFLDFLKDPELPITEREEYVQIIHESSQVLLRLIDDIIDIAKIESGQLMINPSVFALHDLMFSIWKTYNDIRIKRNRHEVDFRLQPLTSKGIIIRSDAIRLQQILSNLLDNAFKFTETGHIELGYETDESDNLTLYVRDTGPGIDPSKHELIFVRFRQLDYSTTKKHGGTGLGLAITKGLVELLGGTIGLESRPGAGSLFQIRLPGVIVKKLVNAIPASGQDYHAFDWTGKTFMIVEDERTNFSLLTIMLRSTKAKIIWARDGEEAVELVKNRTDIDLVLMDIRLPGMDGYQTTKIIKQTRPSLPVLAQTAYAMDVEINLAREAGCDDYITKPIEKKLLLQKISMFLM
jgi:PAS domain S-box-containing protein